MDRISRSQRSQVMAKIRGDNLKPEARMHVALDRAMAGHMNRNDNKLPGSPDFAFPK